MKDMRILVATRKGLFLFAPGADGLPCLRETAFVGLRVSMVAQDPRDGAIYAAVHHEHFGPKIHRSDDLGRTFAECATPTWPEKPEGLEDREAYTGREIPWTLEAVFELAPDGTPEPGGIWCGTSPGGLFRTRDRGASWSLVRSLWDHEKRREWFGGGTDYPALHTVLPDPRDPDRVLVAVSCGGVWLTEDGGARWTLRADGMRADYMPEEKRFDPNVQDPHRVERCAGAPSVLWCQHHNGIFRSTDEGVRWVEIPEAGPSTFGFAVAAHPKDPDTAWFVPASSDERRVPVDGRLVVTRTTDGGRSFETLSRGLPSAHAYDLVYRHALAVDESGERVAFGSTTGALFFSNDGGDTFAELTAHLPPIYTVRFARAAIS